MSSKVTKEEYLKRRLDGPHLRSVYTAEDADFMRKLGEESDRRYCSIIEVAFDAGVDPDGFRVYVDGNIVALGASCPDLAEHGKIIGKIEPGKRRVIVRDRDPRLPGRRESNLVLFEVSPHQRVKFIASVRDGLVELILVGCS